MKNLFVEGSLTKVCQISLRKVKRTDLWLMLRIAHMFQMCVTNQIYLITPTDFRNHEMGFLTHYIWL